MCFVGYWEKSLAHQTWEDLRHRLPRCLVVGMDIACKRSRRRRGTLVLGDPLLDALFPRDSADSSEHWKTSPTTQDWTTKRTRFVR